MKDPSLHQREHFSDLPEPTQQQIKKKPNVSNDTFLDGLERYIDALSKHILKIQEEEAYITNKFTEKLQGLGKSSDKAVKQEDKARLEYQKDLDLIRSKRRQYREMLYDAMLERRKLMESMQLQRDEDDVLRKKLVKLGVLTPIEEAYEHLKSAYLDPFGIIFILLQIILIIFYGVWVTYDDAPTKDPSTGAYVEGLDNRVDFYYHHYTDIAFMVFIGLGFLMTFLRKYAYSAIGFAFFTACFVFQWALLVSAFFDRAYSGSWDRVGISMVDLIQGMYGATTCLVTLGVVMGNVSPLQTLILVLIEVPIYGLNKYICLQLLGGLDYGGSMVIHMFGAYFGFGASYALSPALLAPFSARNPKKKNVDSSYTNDMFALIGTLFLWVLWPSFNSALADETLRYRIISNTILALCTSAVLGFITSRLLRGGKFDMIDIQNATISGGITVAAGAMMMSPAGALITGAVGGAVCVATVVFLQPWLRHWFLDDTRNAQCVHGISGIIGGITSIICAAISIHNEDLYGEDPVSVFPKGSKQASIQLAILFITLGFALIPGLISGLIVRFITKYQVKFTDENEWSVPKDFEPHTVENEVPVSSIVAKR
jgi:ammonium transporter Rh